MMIRLHETASMEPSCAPFFKDSFIAATKSALATLESSAPNSAKGRLADFVAGAPKRGLTGDATLSDDVRNKTAESRFELDADGHTAVIFYRMEPGVITLVHTEVPQPLSGRGVGSRIVRGALEQARALGLKVVPKCPFVSAYMAKHPEFNDLLA